MGMYVGSRSWALRLYGLPDEGIEVVEAGVRGNSSKDCPVWGDVGVEGGSRVRRLAGERGRLLKEAW